MKPAFSFSGRCLLLSLACTMVACAAPPVEPAPTHSVPNASRSSPVIERIKQDVDRLIATPFDDTPRLQALLGSDLGVPTEQDGWRTQTAASGRFAGLPVHDIKLRSSADGQGASVLLLSFDAGQVPFDGAQWPGALPNPPRPDAPGSTAYWEVRQADATVILGMDSAQQHLVQLSIRKH